MGQRGPIGRRHAPPALRIVDTEPKHDGPRPDIAGDKVRPLAAEPPAELSGDLLDLFNDTAAELDRAGLSSSLDTMALALAVTHYGAAMAAARELDSEGPVVMGATGGSVVNPASTVLKAQSAAFGELAKGLGLTFGARARIVLPREDQDGLDKGNPFGTTGKQAAGGE